ncbi:MAG: glycosyl transferase family protein, partial [Betaproteobacteria bacterium]|nr:glycosyl transferase family protein [Betaproteobacteria bacterium]
MIAPAAELLDAAGWASWIQLTLIHALALVAAIMLVSGIDDVLYDAWYWARAARRMVFKRPRIKQVSREALVTQAEQPIAVMIPAWEEAAVLEPMLARLSRTIDYSNYRVYVGVYPNDAATQDAAARAAAHHPRLRIVVLDHNGPTNKADCLNGIWRAILVDEALGCKPFQLFVMHDCEDVIHPLAWRLLNWLIPRKDMVQLPVLSLPRRWWEVTAAHYQDEFAQQHLKDLVVRESMHRSLP